MSANVDLVPQSDGNNDLGTTEKRWGAVHAHHIVTYASGVPVEITGSGGGSGLVFMGAWSDSITYGVNSIVTYNGSSYVSTGVSTGVVPTNASYWAILAQKGASGDGTGDMVKSVYDTDGDGKVNAAAVADEVEWVGVNNKPETYPPDAHDHDYEPELGNPDVSGKVLASTTAGVRSWATVGTGDMLASTYDPIIMAITGEATVGATPDTTLAALWALPWTEKFILNNPADTYVSPSLPLSRNGTMSTMDFYCTGTPASSTNIVVKQGSTTVGTAAISAAGKTTLTFSTAVTGALDDLFTYTVGGAGLAACTVLCNQKWVNR